MSFGGAVSGSTTFGNTGGSSTTTIQSGTGGVGIGTTGTTTIGNTTGGTAVNGLASGTSPTFKAISTSTSASCGNTKILCVDCGSGYVAISASVQCNTAIGSGAGGNRISDSGAASSLNATVISTSTTMSNNRYWISSCISQGGTPTLSVPVSMNVFCSKL
jgi:hypothetical protein